MPLFPVKDTLSAAPKLSPLLGEASLIFCCFTVVEKVVTILHAISGVYVLWTMQRCGLI